MMATAAIGCGGSSYEYAAAPSSGYGGGYQGDVAVTGGAAPVAVDADYRHEIRATSARSDSEPGMAGGDWDHAFSDEEVEGDLVRPDSAGPAAPPPAQSPPPRDPRLAQSQEGQASAGQAAATDAVDVSGPLLIYTAELTLGVFEVAATQERILTSIRELEGFLSQRSDHQMVLRVPAARFEAALEIIETAGDVLGRNVEALDVSEEFRDLQIRIRNAEAMRDRLEQLLTRANDVTAALAIERELQRLTEYIERTKGRQRFLADRISFSTITVSFRSLSTEPTGPDGFVLPFPWLDELGLSNLMRLR
jgi:hypothetical protein